MNKFETISERITPQRKGIPRQEHPDWVKETTEPLEDALKPVEVESSPDVETIITKDTEDSLKAKRFLQLVAGTKEKPGVRPWEAARALGTTIGDLSRAGDVRGALKKLLDQSGGLPSLLRKEAVRAGLNKIFLDNVDGTLKEQKVALSAAKQIATDPEIGLNIPATTGIVIDMSKMGKLMDEIKPIKGLEQMLEVKDGNGE